LELFLATGPTYPFLAAENLLEFTTSKNAAPLTQKPQLSDSSGSSFVKSVAKKQLELVKEAVGLAQISYANGGADAMTALYEPRYEPQTLSNMSTKCNSRPIISKCGKRRILQQDEKSNDNEFQPSRSFISKRSKREALCEECAKLDFEAIFARADLELSEREQRKERNPY
jgi:hypothetical protein